MIVTIAVLAILGQGANIIKLASLNDNKVVMTYSSAIMSVFCAAACFFQMKQNQKWLLIMTSIIALTAVYIMTSWIFNNSKPLMFPLYRGESHIGLDHNMPTFGTVFVFGVFSLNTILKSKFLAYLILFVGCMVILGHGLQISVMYLQYMNYPTGTSFNTGLVFMFLGIFQLINKQR